MQPHQLAVLAVIKFYYVPLATDEPYAREVNVALFDWLLQGIFDLRTPPATFASFVATLESLDMDTEEQEEDLKHCVESLSVLFKKLAQKQIDALQRFFLKFKSSIITERPVVNEEGTLEYHSNNPIERRSPVGVFVRRCLLHSQDLPFDASLNLLDRIAQWVGSAQDHANVEMDTQCDTSPQAGLEFASTLRGRAYDDFMVSRANGHYHKAHQRLLHFFDFRQMSLSERGLHHYALINRVSLYYAEGSYTLARDALNEAVRLSRQVGDRECLNACYGLSKRLDHVDPHGKDHSAGFWSEDFATPLSIDEFWQVRDGLRNGEPTPHIFYHLYRSKALLMPDTVGYKFDRYSLRWEATSAEIWSLLGSPTLTKLHQDMALETSVEENRLAHSPRSTAIAGAAARLAHNGQYDEALAFSLHAACGGLGKLCKKDLDTYQASVWATWRLRAQRKGFERILCHLDSIAPSCPTATNRNAFGLQGDAAPHEIFSDPEDRARFLLAKAQKLKDASQAALALQVILEALALTELPNVSETLADGEEQDEGPERAGPGKGLVALHSKALIMLADLEIDYKAAVKTEQRLVGLWPQILTASDLDLLANSNWIRGRALVAQASPKGRETDADKLRQALPFFQASLALYDQIGHTVHQVRVLSDLATVHDLLSDEPTRDQLATRWILLKAQDTGIEDAWLRDIVEMQGWLANWASQASRLTVDDLIDLG